MRSTVLHLYTIPPGQEISISMKALANADIARPQKNEESKLKRLHVQKQSIRLLAYVTNQQQRVSKVCHRHYLARRDVLHYIIQLEPSVS
jgi:hypothetical protein